ncbi:hypothetical protein N656DRAFT_779075 [Canariomyces notabilis]|uniref:Uncharacterized protein n=1 Tax=Canariomyces notabilis TaxID=2074819 RepID=A0AAN6YSU5_9PEZI|nr:hypothetical protein N656DRAFT_779075 [Canariomyces arenarius]
MYWPTRLSALPVGIATAIEVAALTIRTVSSLLDDPYQTLAWEHRNPLLGFALRCDNRFPLSADLQEKLANDICTAFRMDQEELSLQGLMESYLMRKTFWDMPDLMFYNAAFRLGPEQPWVQSGIGTPGQVSIIPWRGEEDLETAIRKRFGRSPTYPAGEWELFLGAKMPPVFRVLFQPSRIREFADIQWPLVVGPSLKTEQESGKYGACRTSRSTICAYWNDSSSDNSGRTRPCQILR